MAIYANLSTLPDLPLVEIFTMLDFASLHVCRQVCKHWNQMILSNVWGRKTNRGIMEQKFRRYWDTGTREINSSSRSLGFKPQYIAVSGDTIVVTENLGEKESTFLKILCSKEPDEWSLPIDGNILKCIINYRKRPQVSLKEKLTKSNYQLSKNNEHAILHQTRNLLNKNPDQTVRVESAESYREANDTFLKPEELNKVDNVWVLSNHSIKRIKLEQASVEIEERSIIY